MRFLSTDPVKEMLTIVYKGPSLMAQQDLTQHQEKVMDVEHYLQGHYAPLRPD